MKTVKYKDWVFLVDQKLTIETYNKVLVSGADECVCDNCKNYVANRELVFPEEIKELFRALGVDYRREVEVCSYEVLPGGFDHIAGWFHFKGDLLSGTTIRLPPLNEELNSGQERVERRFSIDFRAGNDLTFFEDKTGLVQIEFEATIPWVLNEPLPDSLQTPT